MYYSEYFSFFTFMTVSDRIPGHTVFVSNFATSYIFSQSYRSYTVYFSFLHFSRFLATFQVLQCVFYIFNNIHFSRHTPGRTVCISHFLVFECFPPIYLKQWLCLIFYVFQFSRHIQGPPVCFSQFACFSVFHTKFQDLQRSCLILHIFQFSGHIPCPTVCFSHFACFSVFLTIFLDKHFSCLIFHVIQFSPHIPGHKVFVSHFPSFSVSSP